MLKVKKRAPKKACEVKICLTREEVDAAVQHTLTADVVGIDAETTGCNPAKESPVYKATAFSVQLSVGAVSYFIPTFMIPEVGDFRHLIDGLRPLVCTSVQKLVLHNAKYDYHVFENAGLRPHRRALLADTLAMSYTHNSSYERHGLKECVKRWFGDDTVEFKPTFKVPKLKKNGEPGKATRMPDLIEVITSKQKYLQDIFLERVLPFREKIAGARKAAFRLYLACKGRISKVAAELIISYSALDPVYTARLYEVLKTKMQAKSWANGQNLFDYFNLIEVPYTTVLYRMERRGIPVSKDNLLKAKENAEREIAAALKLFNKLAVKAGASVERMEKFNTKSGKDIAWLFTEVLGIKGRIKRRKNGTESESWDEATLKELALKSKKADPLVQALLAFRDAAKVLSTYIIPFLRFHKEYKGHIHTTYKQTGTKTARLSSSQPNLQNLKREDEDAPPDAVGVRKCFVASENKKTRFLLGCIDQAQIEARLTAHFTQDESFLEAIHKGWDLHSLTATKAFANVREFVGVQDITVELLDEVKSKFKAERQKSKVVNFAIIYGIGAKGLAEQLKCSEREAQELIDGFFNGYPGVKKAMRQTQQFARDKGYIRSMLRRYVYCKDAQSSIRGIQARGQRQSFNFLIQGSSADMVKLAMIKIENDMRLRKMGVQMCLQVHDELVFICDQRYAKKAGPIIEKYLSFPMEAWGFKSLSVPTPAAIQFAPNWAEAK